MKKLIVFFFVILSASLFAQKGVYGWNFGLTTSQAHLYKTAGYRGVRVILPWDAIQTTSSDYSLTTVKNIIKICKDSSLNLELQLWVGPDAPINNPVNWLRLLGVDTFYTHGGSSNGPWPSYYNATYKLYFNKIHKAIADTLHSMRLRGDLPSKVSMFVSNGSTGDEGPYKGVPDVSSYGVFNDDTWDTYKKRQWDTCYNYYKQDTPYVRLTFQPADAASFLLYIRDSLPGSNMKKGRPTHEIPVNGETWLRWWPLHTIYIGEVDAYMKITSSKKLRMQEMFSELECRMGRVDFMSPVADTIPQRDTLVHTFHRYCDQFDVPNNQVKRGFCALADKIDFRDTIEYPTAIYGQVYDSYKVYLQQIHSIEISDDNEYIKQNRRTSTAINRADSMRFVNLDSILNLEYHPFGPFENHSISFDVTPNYSLWITQKEPQKTSKGQWNVGDADALYGRNARIFKYYHGKYEMYFSLNDTLSSGNLVNNILTDSVQFKITYLDSGTARWNVVYSKCTSLSAPQNTNTGLFKQFTFTVPRFQFSRNLPYGSNLEIQLVDGDKNFPIVLIEADVKSK